VSENNIWRTQEVDNCQRVSGERRAVRLRCCLVCNIHFHLSVATKTHGFYHEKPCRTQEVGFVCLLCPEAENSVLPPREIIIPSHKRARARERSARFIKHKHRRTAEADARTLHMYIFLISINCWGKQWWWPMIIECSLSFMKRSKASWITFSIVCFISLFWWLSVKKFSRILIFSC